MFLEAKNIVKRYANHTAVNGVSLSVEKGHIYGLLGPNGAGKTSLIRIINRITAPDEGEVFFDGHPFKAEDISRIGYLPEERGLYRKMKVGEQAIYLAKLKGVPSREARKRLQSWFEKFDIMPWWNKKVEELSKGMQQKVQFVCSIIHDPDLLILDEPFSGFDPVNADLLKKEILELKSKGKTIIFSTHNMQSVEEICDEIGLINKSHLILDGKVSEVRKRFSQNIIRLDFNSNTVLSETFMKEAEIEEIIHKDNLTTVRIHRPEGTTNRDILVSLPGDVELLSFEEEIPSMHDIFVRLVGNSKPSNTETQNPK